MKIGVGSVVKARFVEKEENTREVRIRRTREKVMVYVQAVVGNNKFLVQF